MRVLSNTPTTWNIAAIETSYYCLTLIFLAYITYKTGLLNRYLPWLFLTLYSLLQISGNTIILIAGQGGTPSYIAAILITVGLSPLTLATAGVLHNWFLSLEKEVSDEPDYWDPKADERGAKYLFGFLGLVSGIAAASFVVAGGMITSGTIMTFTAQFLQGAAVLLIFCFLGISFAALRMYWAFRKSAGGHSMAMWSLLVALPFLGLRLVFELIMSFDDRVDFVMVYEELWERVVSDVLPRAVVVLILVVGGWFGGGKKRYERLGRTVKAGERGSDDA